MTANDPVPGGSAELPGPDVHTTAGKLADLERRHHEAVHAGSAAAVDKQHARGKLTARERIALLLDEGSFTEFDELARHRAHDFGIEHTTLQVDHASERLLTIEQRHCDDAHGPSHRRN